MTIEVDISAIRLNRPRQQPATLVENVSFTIPKGATLGIVGESGSGKSLMALAILGLLPKEIRAEGRVVLDGVDLMRLSETPAPACARRQDRHDLPGADDGPQSRHARRRPDRRRATEAQADWPSGGEGGSAPAARTGPHSRCTQASRRLSARTIGRSAAEGRNRDRLGAWPRPSHRRRANDRP